VPAAPYEHFQPRSGQRTFLLYHCSTGSPVGEFCRARPEPLILDYHNITPAELFEPWEPHIAVELAAGRSQLAELAPSAVLGLADSEFNEQELRRLGCPVRAVVPIIVDLEAYHAPPDSARVERAQVAKRAGGRDWLFVGRLSPNKAQHDLVQAFAAYRAVFDPLARLHLVGGSSSSTYERALRALVADLDLGSAVEFSARLPEPALLAAFVSADVFVCLSDHEGFCVPVVEAMELGVPVVALRATAVPETIGSGGLLLPSKEPLTVAAAVHRVLTDAALGQRLVEAGHRRARDFRAEKSSAALLAALAPVVG
jgi:glycosyltransferase involved in cell wall biosynthesis